MDTREGLRRLRVTWAFFLGLAIASIAIGEWVAYDRGPISRTTFWALTALALWSAWSAHTWKKKLIDPGRAELQGNPQDQLASKKVRAGYAINFAVGNAVVLYG